MPPKALAAPPPAHNGTGREAARRNSRSTPPMLVRRFPSAGHHGVTHMINTPTVRAQDHAPAPVEKPPDGGSPPRPAPTFDQKVQMTAAWLRLFIPPGQVTELRALGVSEK